jgi:hypothetical protein
MRAFLQHDPVGASPIRIAFLWVAVKGRLNGSPYGIGRVRHRDLQFPIAKAIATTNGLTYVKLTAFAACHRAPISTAFIAGSAVMLMAILKRSAMVSCFWDPLVSKMTDLREVLHRSYITIHSSSFYFVAEGFQLWFDGFPLARPLGHRP